MRFAYIDSQGKEVGIPTVEALQLRIELGAIVASTMFFDATSDRWAPAREHEIFRSLQREVTDQGDAGFVASPPVLGGGPPVPDTEPPPVFADSYEQPAPPVPKTATPPAAAEPTRPGVPGAKADALEIGKFTLAPMDDLYASIPADQGTTPPHGDPLDSAFERTSLAFPDLQLGSPPVSGSQEQVAESASDGVLDVGPLAPPPTPPEDLPLETLPGQRWDASESSRWREGRGFQPGLSTHDAGGPPGWADEDAGPAARQLSSPPPEVARPPEPASAARPPAPRGEAPTAPSQRAEVRREAPRRQPRSRPLSTSRPPSKPALPAPALAGTALLVLALVGGAGWYGWSLIRERSSAAEEVELPALPAELEGTFRELAPAALADAVTGMTDRFRGAALPADPPADWLAGQYLANASRYPEVAAYWQTLTQALADLRSQQEPLFRAAFEARMAAASLSPDDERALLDRAVAGFRAALPERDRAWEQLSAVFAAALGLHDFLLENEDEIDYEPAAAGISRDPVLEAVPATRELGDVMWQRVDEITSALEAMDALTDRVTTERLFSRALERVGKTPVH